MSVTHERVRTVTLHHAETLAAIAPAPVRTLPACGAAHIVAEADGTMVPVVDTTTAWSLAFSSDNKIEKEGGCQRG